MGSPKICLVSSLLLEGNANNTEKFSAMLEGNARITHELATQLTRLGEDVIVVTDGPKRNLSMINREYEIKTIGQRFSLKNVSFLGKYIEKMKPNIVHFHGGKSMSYFARFFKLWYRRPTIFTFTFAPSNYLRSISLPWRNEGFDHVIALTQFARNNLIADEAFDSGCLSVIPYGISQECLDYSIPANPQIKETIIYIGNLTYSRGFDTFLRSIPIIQSSFKNAEFLVFVRSASELERFPQRILGLKLMKPTELVENLCLSSFVVIPFSKCVAVDPPLSVLECMARKKAVVTNPLGSIPEILGYNRGILVPPSEPKQLADAVSALLENEQLSKSIGENARQYILKRYDWKIAISSIMKIYNCHL